MHTNVRAETDHIPLIAATWVRLTKLHAITEPELDNH